MAKRIRTRHVDRVYVVSNRLEIVGNESLASRSFTHVFLFFISVFFFGCASFLASLQLFSSKKRQMQEDPSHISRSDGVTWRPAMQQCSRVMHNCCCGANISSSECAHRFRTTIDIELRCTPVCVLFLLLFVLSSDDFFFSCGKHCFRTECERKRWRKWDSQQVCLFIADRKYYIQYRQAAKAGRGTEEMGNQRCLFPQQPFLKMLHQCKDARNTPYSTNAR